MCFSASASFTASAFLILVGCAAQTQTRSNNERLFAAIPFIFGIQQACEGVLWLSLSSPSPSWVLTVLFQWIYLIIAFAIWPLWISLSFLKLESNPTRKKWLYATLALGITFVISVFAQIPQYGGNELPNIQFRSIQYGFRAPDLHMIVLTFIYLIATAIPPIISSFKGSWIFGIATALSFAAGYYLKHTCMISVWCFFNAICSLLIFFIIRHKNLSSSL